MYINTCSCIKVSPPLPAQVLPPERPFRSPFAEAPMNGPTRVRSQPQRGGEALPTGGLAGSQEGPRHEGMPGQAQGGNPRPGRPTPPSEGRLRQARGPLGL